MQQNAALLTGIRIKL